MAGAWVRAQREGGSAQEESEAGMGAEPRGLAANPPPVEHRYGETCSSGEGFTHP